MQQTDEFATVLMLLKFYKAPTDKLQMLYFESQVGNYCVCANVSRPQFDKLLDVGDSHKPSISFQVCPLRRLSKCDACAR